MHPILARPARLVPYLGTWLPLGCLLAALLRLQGVFGWVAALAAALPLAVLCGFLALSAWYVAGGTPIERMGPVRVGLSAAGSAFLSAALWLLLARGWFAVLPVLTDATGTAAAFRAAAPTLFAFGFLLYLLAMAASYVGMAIERSREADRRGLHLEVQAREAELRALRAQVDPHFLFNSLQSISALTTADPAAARRMCLLLADFLRDTLALGGQRRIPLAREVMLVRRFLAIEQVRFGDRLQVDIETGGAEDAGVPPLLLQPLVENAVTHGVAHVLSGGAVRLRAVLRQTSLVITIDNPADADRPAGRGTGLGLRNVRERLRSAYGEDAFLQTEERDGRFTVRVEVPTMEQLEDSA